MTKENRYDCEDRGDGYFNIVDKETGKNMNVGLVVYKLNKMDKLLLSLKKAFKTRTMQLDINPMSLDIDDYRVINEWLKGEMDD